MTTPVILLGVPDLSGEADIVARLTRPGTPLVVARRCVDAVDMLGAAAAGSASVAIVGAGLPRLTHDTVSRLSASEVRAIGLVQDDDEVGARRLRALGIPIVTVGEDLETAIVDLTGAVLGRVREPFDADASSAPASAGADGRIICVWGPTGAPGRTSVAIAIADEAARSGVPALLVDADTHGGAVATHLGLLDDVSGIVVACRHADSGALDSSGLAAAARTLHGSLRVLTGIPTASRWAELRPTALGRLWEACRETPGITVVDGGFGLERDEEMLFDTRSPRRHAATLTAVEAADLIVAVGAADPVGVDRLLRGMEDLRAIVPDAPVSVVVTRTRRSVLGRDPEGQVRDALRRHAGIGHVTFVPDDRDAFDSCLREGRTLAEVAPRSAARSVLREFTSRITAPAEEIARAEPARHSRLSRLVVAANP